MSDILNLFVNNLIDFIFSEDLICVLFYFTPSLHSLNSTYIMLYILWDLWYFWRLIIRLHNKKGLIINFCPSWISRYVNLTATKYFSWLNEYSSFSCNVKSRIRISKTKESPFFDQQDFSHYEEFFVAQTSLNNCCWNILCFNIYPLINWLFKKKMNRYLFKRTSKYNYLLCS